MLRTLEEQFESDKAAQLRKLSERLRTHSFPPGASRYYGLELASCIEAGALLGALVVGSSLLEIYVRALVVNHASIARLTSAHGRKSLEAILEEKRSLGFKALIDSLVSVGLFDNEDGERAKILYDNVRIPLLHGLPRRFVRKHQEPDAEEFSQLFKGEAAISSMELERIIEGHALEYLESVVGIVEKNIY